MSEPIEEQLPPVLDNEEQYRSELDRIPRLSTEEQQWLETLAKAGDSDAGMQIILVCLHFVSWEAMQLARTYLRYDDYLDLVQIGNLALVECLERALQAKGPIAYLCATARRAMRDYCFYHSKLIRVPVHPENIERAPQIASIDELIVDDEEGGGLWMADPFAEIENLDASEQPAFEAWYGSLQEALGTLTEKEREVVVRHHGLDDYGPETLAEINRRISKRGGHVAHSRYYTALERLRQYFNKRA